MIEGRNPLTTTDRSPLSDAHFEVSNPRLIGAGPLQVVTTPLRIFDLHKQYHALKSLKGLGVGPDLLSGFEFQQTECGGFPSRIADTSFLVAAITLIKEAVTRLCYYH
jgi:hypothetical protein